MTAFNPHAYLNSLANFESKLHQLRPEDFNIDRIKRFLTLAGDPAHGLKIVHVAGTKGKGSTCVFLAGILQEAGYKVGLYTSPHLHKVNERIKILKAQDAHSPDPFRGSISDEELGQVLKFLQPLAAAVQNEGHVLTYFEVLTVAALVHFARAKTDIVILETGLGGRLDATNAVDSQIAVITPISLDHTAILGSTIGQIASEKAGIIKDSRQKVVLAPQEKEAMDVLLQRCRELDIAPVLVAADNVKDFSIGLKGQHQKINAATALETAALLKTLGFNISGTAMAHGLKNVRWPGRFELLKRDPDVIVDGAHNDASAKALAETIAEEYPQRRVILVLGISQDKDIAAICRHLKNSARHFILTKAGHPRSHVFTATDAQNYLGDKPFEITENIQQALEQAMRMAGPQDVIVVTGSLFLVAEAISAIKYVPV